MQWFYENTITYIYKIVGKFIKEYFGLTGNNAYKDDLNLITIKLDQLKDIVKLSTIRFDVVSRLYDNIVNNNRVNII